VQDALGVGAVDGEGYLRNQEYFLFQTESSQMQRLAIDELHRNVGLRLELSDFEHLADVVVV